MRKVFDEPSALNDVSEFHDLFNLPVIDKPAIPTKERCELRVNLIAEELDELRDAIADGDLVEIADALTDIQYVLSGAVLEFGLGAQFKHLFDAVHQSNMSKACATMEEAEQTKRYYMAEKNTDAFIEKKGDLYLVYRKSDKKVLKSINYQAVEISDIMKV